MANPKAAAKAAGNTDHDHVYVATQSGSCDVNGETFVFVRDVTRVRADHPLLKSVPDYFKPVEDGVHYDVEQATAGPGEKRGSRGAE